MRACTVIIIAIWAAACVAALCYRPYVGCGQFICADEYAYFRNPPPLGNLELVELDLPILVFEIGVISVCSMALWYLAVKRRSWRQGAWAFGVTFLLYAVGLVVLRQYTAA